MTNTIAPLYHGTHQHFDAFEPRRCGLVFFAESRAYAEAYGPIVKAARLTIEHLADLDHDPVARSIAIANFDQCNYRNVDDGWSDTFDPENDETWELTESPTFVEAMRAAGYDGAVFSEGEGRGRAYAVFDVKQIKLLDIAPAKSPVRSPAQEDTHSPGVCP